MPFLGDVGLPGWSAIRLFGHCMQDQEPLAAHWNIEHAVLGLAAPTEPKDALAPLETPYVWHAELIPERAQDIESTDCSRCLSGR